MTDKAPIKQLLAEQEAEVARLQGIIAGALAAMDRCEYGTARRVLQTGNAAPPKASTGVIARDGGSE